MESGVGVCSGQQTDDAMQTLIRATMALRYTVHGLRSHSLTGFAELHPLRLLEAERAPDHQIGSQVLFKAASDHPYLLEKGGRQGQVS